MAMGNRKMHFFSCSLSADFFWADTAPDHRIKKNGWQSRHPLEKLKKIKELPPWEQTA